MKRNLIALGGAVVVLASSSFLPVISMPLPFHIETSNEMQRLSYHESSGILFGAAILLLMLSGSKWRNMLWIILSVIGAIWMPISANAIYEQVIENNSFALVAQAPIGPPSYEIGLYVTLLGYAMVVGGSIWEIQKRRAEWSSDPILKAAKAELLAPIRGEFQKEYDDAKKEGFSNQFKAEWSKLGIGWKIFLPLAAILGLFLIIGAAYERLYEQPFMSFAGKACAGTAVPEAAQYKPEGFSSPSTFHPLIVLDRIGNWANDWTWSNHAWDKWQSSTPQGLQLVACIQESVYSSPIDCHYTDGTVATPKSKSIHVVLRSIYSGEPIAETTLNGDLPSCPLSPPSILSGGQIMGSNVSWDDLQTWLEPYVNPPH